MAHNTKGARSEFRCKQDLEKDGFIVEKVKKTKWNPIDFFDGNFDILAKKKNEMKYIQVKTNKVDKNAIDKIREFKKRFGNVNESYELWVWYDRKSWEKIII